MNMISVCIATYNGEAFVKEQILSITSQIGKDDEIIVSDDGSTDNTIKIIKSINDSRIRIIYNHGNHHYTKNFENALSHSKGDIIFLSDQDDIWCKNKVEIVKKDLIQEDYDFITSDAIIIDSKNSVINKSYWSKRKPLFSPLGDYVYYSYLGCCMAFKRKVLEKALPFPNNPILCNHDYWLQLIGDFYYKVKYEETPLIYYRRHSSNVSKGGDSEGTTLFMKCKYRLYCLFHLINRAFSKNYNNN